MDKQNDEPINDVFAKRLIRELRAEIAILKTTQCQCAKNIHDQAQKIASEALDAELKAWAAQDRMCA